MSFRHSRGQCLVEVAVSVPILLVIFAGLYVACRTGFLASAIQSAAHAQTLRSGRGMPGIEKQLVADLLPGEDGVSVANGTQRDTRLLPRPFPDLTGRSSAIVSVDRVWRETGAIGGFPPLALVRRSDMSVDCWDRTSRSGRRLRGVVRARVALGVIR